MARDFSTLYSLYLCFKLTFQGILDACRVDIFLLSLRNDITILLSIFLNSVLFFGASYLMQITAPIIVTAIFSSIHDELAYADSFRELAFFISHLIVNCFSYFMFYAWTIPWNISWLGPTAREIYRKKKGDPPASGEEIPSMISMFAFRMVFTMSFSLQTLVLSFIPITGKGLYWFSFCCINSFLFFELTWSIESKRFVKNMERFEENWPYYIGFGVPFTLLCYPFTGAIQLALMGCLMQMFSIIAVGTEQKTWYQPENVAIPTTIHFFDWARKMADSFLYFIPLPKSFKNKSTSRTQKSRSRKKVH